jgi:hypothetical protein
MTQQRRLSPFVMAVGLLSLVSGPCLAQVGAFGWDLIDPAWVILKFIGQIRKGGTSTAGSTAFKTTQAGSIA